MNEKEKERHKRYMRQWRKDHVESVKASKKKWKEENPDKVKKDRENWKNKNKDKMLLYKRRHMRKWRENYPEKAKEYEKSCYEKYHEKILHGVKLYRQKNPQRTRAHKRIWYLLVTNQIKKPTRCSCCGIPGNLDGHHENYDRQDCVIWLCKKCHFYLHRKPDPGQRVVEEGKEEG